MEDLSQHSSNPIGQTLTPIYNNDNNKNISSSSSSLPHFEPESEPEPEPQSLKAKITSHPHYSTLLHAYVDCHSVGAPPDVASRLSSSLSRHFHHHAAADHVHAPKTPDPELDHFMEVYCEMLACYREELTRPLKEAMDFITMVESQLNSLSTADEKCGAYSLGEQQEDNGGDIGISEIHDSVQSDRELKRHLLKKYGGCLGSLKQQLSKKKKKGKLPKDARQKLLGWWDLHYKWPYPSENEKVALAESTGLNQKQINNWFINQRKRHWKPSDNHQQFVLEGYHPQNPKSTPDAAFCAEDGRFVGSDGLYCMGP